MFPRLYPLELNSSKFWRELFCDYAAIGFASLQVPIFSILPQAKTSNNSGDAEMHIDMNNKQ